MEGNQEMSKVFEHILVPYNGTSGSNKSFRKAISIASLTSARVTILTCLEERPSFGFFKTKTSKQEFEKEKKSVERQQKILEEFASNHNVTCKSKIVKNGFASTGIIEFAKKNDVDLVIMTKTKISSRYEKMHYQSTIENVLRNAVCPTLVL